MLETFRQQSVFCCLNLGAFGGANVDSARQNLASSFVNGFVNAGYGQDKLITTEGNKWIYKHKEGGM